MAATPNLTFSQWLEAAIADSLYLGSSADDLQTEVATNMWALHGTPRDLADFDVNQLRDWLEKVIVSRERQLLNWTPDRRAILYIWVDTQLVQLRFSVISDAHERLPFRREYRILPTLDPILGNFLDLSCSDANHDGMEWSDEDSDPWDEWEKTYVVQVYAVALPRHVWSMSDWTKREG